MASARRFALLVLLLPILELVLLVQIGGAIGFWPTFGLVLLGGLVGVATARLTGVRTFFRFQSELAQGRLPGRALLDGVAMLLGAVLLIVPGVLTDLAGLALLFPPTRRWLQKRAQRRLERGMQEGSIRVVRGVSMRYGAGSPGRSGGSPEGAGQAATGEIGPVDEEGRALDPSKGIVVE